MVKIPLSYERKNPTEKNSYLPSLLFLSDYVLKQLRLQLFSQVFSQAHQTPHRSVKETTLRVSTGKDGLHDTVCILTVRSNLHPSKTNATQLWSIIFLLSWISIHQVRYPWKACLFASRLMLYLLGLFHWGACRVSKLGAMSKRKSCKIYPIEWEMHAMSSFGLFFCECMHAYPLPICCAEILRKYRKISAQWMSSGYVC